MLPRRAAAMTALPVVVTRSSVSRSYFMSLAQRPTIWIMCAWRFSSWASSALQASLAGVLQAGKSAARGRGDRRRERRERNEKDPGHA